MRNYKLHLLRHGITADNELGILAGCGRDTHLSPEGRAEIEEMKEKFSYPHIEALFCSPMMRAVQTAQILYPQHKAILVAPLVEAAFGELEGATYAEVEEQGFWETWREEKDPFTAKGLETYKDFHARVTAAFATLLEGMMKSGVKEAALVTHSGVIAAILGQFGLPQLHEDAWLADNGAGYTISVSPATWQRTGMVEVVAVQPAGYLASLGYEEAPAPENEDDWFDAARPDEGDDDSWAEK